MSQTVKMKVNRHINIHFFLYFSISFIHTIKKKLIIWHFCCCWHFETFYVAKPSYLKWKHQFYTNSQGWKQVEDISSRDRISVRYIIPVGIQHCYNVFAYLVSDYIMKSVSDDLKSIGKPFTALFTAEKPSQVCVFPLQVLPSNLSQDMISNKDGRIAQFRTLRWLHICLIMICVFNFLSTQQKNVIVVKCRHDKYRIPSKYSTPSFGHEERYYHILKLYTILIWNNIIWSIRHSVWV